MLSLSHCVQPGNNVLPDWGMKWAALTLEFIEHEKATLPGALLSLPPPYNTYTQESAENQAAVGPGLSGGSQLLIDACTCTAAQSAVGGLVCVCSRMCRWMTGLLSQMAMFVLRLHHHVILCI